MPKYKHLTIEERQIIEQKIQQGLAIKAIAREISRSSSVIWREISLNGGTENYNAQGAQQRAEKLRIRTNLNLFTMSIPQIVKRFVSLEMQIQILSETIKEILNERKNN